MAEPCALALERGIEPELAFEALAARADALRAAGEIAGALRSAQSACALYGGELLGDDEHPLVVEPRSRLAERLRRLTVPPSP